MHINLLLVLIVVGIAASVDVAQWSAWSDTPNTPCSDDCGYCGVRVVAERTCPTAGKCSGVSQRYEECGSKMCKWGSGKRTCCAGYVKGLVNNQFECVALANIAAKKKLI